VMHRCLVQGIEKAIPILKTMNKANGKTLGARD